MESLLNFVDGDLANESGDALAFALAETAALGAAEHKRLEPGKFYRVEVTVVDEAEMDAELATLETAFGSG